MLKKKLTVSILLIILTLISFEQVLAVTYLDIERIVIGEGVGEYYKSHIIENSTGAGSYYQKRAVVHYGSTWSAVDIEQLPPMTREHGIFAANNYLNGCIYITCGRVSSTRKNYNDEYNITSKTWAQKANFPRSMDAPASGVLLFPDGKYRISVVCGYPVSGNLHYAYDPIADLWTQYSDSGIYDRWDVTGSVVDNKLYVIAGSDDWNTKKSVWIYNPDTNSWSYGKNCNYGRAKHAASVYDGKIYVFSSGWVDYHNHTEVYDPQENEWAILNDSPVQMISSTKFSVDGYIYLMGIDYQFWKYDPSTDTYEQMEGAWEKGKGHSYEMAADENGRFYFDDRSELDFFGLDATYYGSDSGEHVGCNSKCKTDFTDIEFKSSDGETPLDYWMYRKVDSNYAVFWYKVDENLDSQNRTVFMNYGNPLGSSESNGTATMADFDDFEYEDSVENHGWVIEGTGGTPVEDHITTTTSYVWYGSRSLKMWDYDYYSYCRIRRSFNAGNQTAFKMHIAMWSTTNYHAPTYTTFHETQGGTIYAGSNMYAYGSWGKWRYIDSAGSWVLVSPSRSFTDHVWYVHEVILDANDDEYKNFYVDEWNCLTNTSCKADPENFLYIKLNHGYTTWYGSYACYDIYYVRKWIPNEPKHGSYGNEGGGLVYPETILVSELEPNYIAKLYNGTTTSSMVCEATANSQGIATLELPYSYRASEFEGTLRIYDNEDNYIFGKWFEDVEGGDEYKMIILTPPPVGGIWVPADKLALLAPYIALVSTILVATAATAIYAKHIKRKKKKQ